MAITDVLAEIKNYFLNWHTNNYITLHTRETNQVTNQSPDKDYLVHSGAIKSADDAIRRDYAIADTNLQNQIDDINNNKLSKKLNNNQYATANPINGIRYAEPDVRGLDPAPLTTYQNGMMSWRDKAELIALGQWYECVNPVNVKSSGQYGFRSIDIYSTMWVNPALRIVYFKFACSKFKKNWWDESQKSSDYYMATSLDLTNEGDSVKGSSFWDQIAPIYHIWAPTNNIDIDMGMTRDGILTFRSRNKITKDITIYGSLFWFYRDGSSYSRWHV